MGGGHEPAGGNHLKLREGRMADGATRIDRGRRWIHAVGSQAGDDAGGARRKENGIRADVKIERGPRDALVFAEAAAMAAGGLAGGGAGELRKVQRAVGGAGANSECEENRCNPLPGETHVLWLQKSAPVGKLNLSGRRGLGYRITR